MAEQDNNFPADINEYFKENGAWGWNQRQRITHTIDNFLRRISNRPHDHEPLQIIYDIKSA